MRASKTGLLAERCDPIIPTRLKYKIAHTHSYPLGAEVISRALLDTPQFSELVLHFTNSRWRSESPLRVRYLVVSYSPRKMNYNPVDTSGIPLFSTWEIDVQPVLRSMRRRIREYALAEALPMVRSWLVKRAGLENPGSDRLAFDFLIEDDAFAMESSRRLQPLQH